MNKKYTEKELKAVAFQLSYPTGDFGIEVANQMSKTNGNLIKMTIDNLMLLPNHNILEIGHGNAKHLHYLFSKTTNIEYNGLEISKLMNEEARVENLKLIKNKKASFYMYNGRDIPFEDNKFDKIFTVNTIYFWKYPHQFINEISRVLKKNGVLTISLIKSESMKKLPFTKFGFKLYNCHDIKALIKSSALKVNEIVSGTEKVINNTGELVNREYLIMSLQK